MRLDHVQNAALLLAAASFAFATTVVADPYDNAPNYIRPVAPDIVITKIITTGQQVPLLGGPPASLHRFLGIPDGLGAVGGNGQLTLLVNHEFNKGSSVPQGPLASGARISQVDLTYVAGGAPVVNVVGAKLAFSRVYDRFGALVAPGTARIARFCAAFLGGADVGFDRPIFLNGEESGGADTFDGLGGAAWATYDDGCWLLPRMGRAPWENVVAVPSPTPSTILIGLEDGSGSAFASQVYMYVGAKDPASADPLNKNGLNNGELFVLAVPAGVARDEAAFAVKGASVPVIFPSVNWNQADGALEVEAQSKNSFNFIRVEDGASDKQVPGRFWFVTTGSPSSPGNSNRYGRLYRLDFNPANPVGSPATLTLVLDGSEGVISPDNIDINAQGELAICEDPNYNLANPPLGLARDSYLWIYNVNTTALTALVEVDRPAANAHALAADPLNVAPAGTPGAWETSGVIDAEPWFGTSSWILAVQAHTMRINPSVETVEGGQILLISQDKPTPSYMGVIEGETQGGTVSLRWYADRGADFDGFHVERATSADGPWARLTDTMLAGDARSFTDAPGTGNWLYVVEAYRGGSLVYRSEAFGAEIMGSSVGALAFRAPSVTRGTATLAYVIPAELAGTRISLELHDVTGRRVEVLVQGTAEAGEHTVTWKPTSAQAAGVYFARLTTVSGSLTKRIALVP